MPAGIGEVACNAVFASLSLKSPSHWEENIIMIQVFIIYIRTVPTFATAHTFCPSCDGPRKTGFITVVPAKTEIFLHGL